MGGRPSLVASSRSLRSQMPALDVRLAGALADRYRLEVALGLRTGRGSARPAQGGPSPSRLRRIAGTRSRAPGADRLRARRTEMLSQVRVMRIVKAVAE